MKIRKYINNKFNGHTKLTVANVKRLEKISEQNDHQPYVHKYLSKPASMQSLEKNEREDSNEYEKHPLNAPVGFSTINNIDEVHYASTGVMEFVHGDARSDKARSNEDARSHHSRSIKSKQHHMENHHEKFNLQDDDTIQSLSSNNQYPYHERSIKSSSSRSRSPHGAKNTKTYKNTSNSRKAPMQNQQHHYQQQHHHQQNPTKRPSMASSYKESSGESSIMPLPRLYKDAKSLSQQQNYYAQPQRYSVSGQSDI